MEPDVLELYNRLPLDERRQMDRMIAEDVSDAIWAPLINENDPDIPTPQEQAFHCKADILLYGGAAGGGKRIGTRIKIPTKYGFKEMGDLVVGDEVFSEDGSLTKVVAVSEVESPEDSYRMEFDTGESIEACGRHLWKTMTEAERQAAFKRTDEYREKRRASRPSRAKEVSQKPWASKSISRINSEREYEYKLAPDGTIRTTQEILETLNDKGYRLNHSVAVGEAIQCDRKVLPIDPYLLGLWLGDGYSNDGVIGMMTSDLDDILDYIDWPYTLSIDKSPHRKQPFGLVRFKDLRPTLREIGVFGNKNIPAQYLRASIGQRIALLAGIMDTDGTCDARGQCEIGFSNERLLNDTWELLSSLGIKCTVRYKKLSHKNPNHKDHYRLKFVAKIPVFRLKRKLERQKVSGFRPTVFRRYITKVERIDPVPMRCIQVAHPTGMYLVGRSFIPTHNSALAIGLALTAHQRSLILRRESKQTNAIVEEILRIRGTRRGYNGQLKRFDLGDGKMVQLGGCQYEHTKEDYRGTPFDLHVFDEASAFTESQFRFIIAWNRTVNPNQRCRVLAASNPPSTAEGQWLITFWAPWLDPTHPNPALPGELRWFVTDGNGDDIEVDGPEPVEIGGETLEPKSRTFIPSSVEDNPFLMATGYKKQLQALPEPLRSQMLKGDFTAGREDSHFQVIPREWVDRAFARWAEKPPEGVRMSAIGLDPARGGRDKTVFAPRYKNWFDRLKVHKGIETPEGSDVAALGMQYVRDGAPIFIDIIGGAAPYEHMKANSMNVFPVDGRKTSHARALNGLYGFANKRSELWWRFREALDPSNREEIALPPDPELMGDLCAPRYQLTSKGITVESKGNEKHDEKGNPTGLMKRLGRSPDKGDAVVYAWQEASSKRPLAGLPKRTNRKYKPHKWRR